MRSPTLLVVALVTVSSFVAFAPSASARPDTPALCSDAMNDAGTCPGALCVWPTPTSAGACTKPSPAKVCTSGHAECGPFDVVCVYGGKVNECVTFVCACMPASAAPECTGCLPWVCVAGVNADACYGEDGPHDVCIGFSLEIPFCTDLPSCDACVTIDCSTLRPLCDPTDPCGWGWFECVPCACVPAQMVVETPAPHVRI